MCLLLLILFISDKREPGDSLAEKGWLCKLVSSNIFTVISYRFSLLRTIKLIEQFLRDERFFFPLENCGRREHDIKYELSFSFPLPEKNE